METETTTAAEKLAGLLCPIRQDGWDDDAGGSHPPVCRCQGTGLKYPMLSQECAFTETSVGLKCFNFSLDHVHGRVPNVTLETLLAAARSQGIHHIDIDYENNWVYIELTPEGHSPDEFDLPHGQADTDIDALANALWAAEQAQRHQHDISCVPGCKRQEGEHDD